MRLRTAIVVLLLLLGGSSVVPAAVMHGGLQTNAANGASTDNISHGTLGAVDWASFTVGGWWMPTSVTLAQRALWSKGVNAGARIHFQQENGTLGSVSLAWLRATTNTIYVSTTGYLVANHPVCIFVTGNQSGGANDVIHFYFGDLTTPLTETTYASRNDGSGAFTSIAAQPFRMNTTEVPSISFAGVVFSAWVFENRILARGQMQQLCENYSAARGMQPSLMARYGTNGTGRVLDESGHNYHGTITGAIPASVTLPRVGWRRPGL